MCSLFTGIGCLFLSHFQQLLYFLQATQLTAGSDLVYSSIVITSLSETLSNRVESNGDIPLNQHIPKTPVTGSRPRNSNFIRPSWDRRNLMLDAVIFRFPYPQPWKLSTCTAVSSDSGGFEQAGNSERKRLRWWRASLDLDAAGIRATACVTADQRRQCKASWATVKLIKSNQQKSSMLLKKSDVLYHEDHCNAEM